jgi:hypothetical protein
LVIATIALLLELGLVAVQAVVDPVARARRSRAAEARRLRSWEPAQ